MNAWIAALREELTRPLPGLDAQMQMAPSLMRTPPKPIPMRDSGVLLLLYPVNEIFHIVFMKRPEYGGIHSGQISFPGGKSESMDNSLIETAIRESREEIGIEATDLEVLGTLSPLHIPVSNFKVLPVVGYLAQRPEFRTDPEEVAYLIETGLAVLLDLQNRKKEILQFEDIPVEVPFFDVQGHHIWGATAMILSEFLEIIRRIR